MARATPYPDNSLISSDDIIQSDVYGAGNAVIGEIDHVMIEKDTGQIVYVVLKFGDLLNPAPGQYPIPWSDLRYDTTLGGYRMTLSAPQLKDGPKFGDDGW
jgi:hypothetical protein